MSLATLLDIERQWRQVNSGWLYAPDHECNPNKCEIEQLDVRSYTLEGYTPHICVRSCCLDHPPWTARAKRRRISNIFMCTTTGIGHLCNDQCNGKRILNEDNTYICCISGIQYESASANTWVPSGRITASRQEAKDPHVCCLTTTNHIGTIRANQHVMQAQKIVHHLLFSSRRLFTEQRKYVEMKMEAEKSVQKYIRHCEQKKVPKVLTTMIELYMNQMNRRRVFRNLLPKKRSIDEITKTYAKRCTACWNMIVTKTPVGIETPSLFPIKIFVVSMLYLMKRGLFVQGVEVFPKNHYLESVLPEANTLDTYDVHKPAFTQCKNNILRALREACELDHRDPRSFIVNHEN